MSTGIDTTTFSRARISQAGISDGDVSSYLDSLVAGVSSPSAALKEARAGFAAIAEERSDPTSGSVGDRLAAMRKSLAKSRETSEQLGKEALGVEPIPRQAVVVSDEERIAMAAQRAAKKFGTPSASVGDADPARPITPAPAKSADKQIS